MMAPIASRWKSEKRMLEAIVRNQAALGSILGSISRIVESSPELAALLVRNTQSLIALQNRLEQLSLLGQARSNSMYGAGTGQTAKRSTVYRVDKRSNLQKPWLAPDKRIASNKRRR